MEVQDILKISKELIEGSALPPEQQINQLSDVLRFHEHRYYVKNDPLISDFEYDSLFKLLQKLEQELLHPTY